MKKLLMVGVSAFLLLGACKDRRYIDLTSGAYIDVEKDGETGRMINSETKKPVHMYVDTRSNDTIYGETGEVINGHVVKTGDGKYKYDGEDEYKIKGDDYKKKVDGDEMKIKSGDSKIKIDGDEVKIKND